MDERYCAECFIPIDGRRPGCQACKQRDLYQRMKATDPERVRMRNRIAHVRTDMSRGFPWATRECLEQRVREYRAYLEAQAA